MRHLRTSALALVAAIVLAACTVSSHPSEVYVLTIDGKPIGAYGSAQSATSAEAGYTAEDQKHMLVTAVRVSE
jgi:hypothetical protein